MGKSIMDAPSSSVEIFRASNGYVVYMPQTKALNAFIQMGMQVQKAVNPDDEVESIIQKSKELIKPPIPVCEDIYVFKDYRSMISFLAELEDKL